MLGQAAPTTMIGIDETRARSVRWTQQEAQQAGSSSSSSATTGGTTGGGTTRVWRRSDPWMTSIVDLDLDLDLDQIRPGGIIGLAAGRSGACVQGWLELQTRQFRQAAAVVVIDPSAPYAAALRRMLPHARIVLDHFHLIMLGNAMVTQVRQRALREQLGRRGTKADRAWVHGPREPSPVR